MAGVRRPAADGPDAELLARLRAAVDRWEAGGRGPTSSLTGGGAIAELEARLAELCGTNHAVCVSSGTIALRIAAQAVGVGRGGEVVVPALDWPAAAAAALSLGARPVPADCGPGAILIDPEAVRRAIGPRTQAIVVTHLAGMPADMDALRRVASAAGVPLIEDGSQAMGASYRGRRVGSFGAAAAFSLGRGKLIDAGEGGVVATDDESLYAAVVLASQHPARQMRAGLSPSPLALATRLHPAAALLGLVQLDGVAAALEHRRAVAEEIRDRAVGTAAVLVPEPPDRRFSWPSVLAFSDVDATRALSRRGVGAAPAGFEDVGALIDSPAACPNAARSAAGVHRLHLKDHDPLISTVTRP